MDNSHDLEVLLGVPGALLVVETDEEQRFMQLLQDIAANRGYQIWTWSSTSGLTNDAGQSMYRTENPHQALSWLVDIEAPSIFVFADAHPILSDSYVIRRIKETAAEMPSQHALVFTTPHGEIPPELASSARTWKLRPPDQDELIDLIKRTSEDLRARGFEVQLEPSQITQFAGTLKGLSIHQAERVLQDATIGDGSLSGSDLAAIRSAKAELFTAEGVLELVEANVGTLADVGGLDGIKDWLSLRQKARNAPNLGLPAPRGVLLTGIPGCGKSFIAKTLARTWNQPLLLLDPARLYNKFHGESEDRLMRSLSSADAMAPAVLWIDEIEKGFASSGEGDGGLSKRLLGTFLRWMQDRPDGVFLIATANDVSSLPPEFLRKGRFDEVFFVDLPADDARKEIFGLHLGSRGYKLESSDLDYLVQITEGFSGAEIEAGVVGAMYRAFSQEERLGMRRLTEEFSSAIPLSQSRFEDVARWRDWASTRAIPA